MKFFVPNYSCLQNPWLWGYRPQIPVLSVFCPQLNLLNPPNKIPGYATDGYRYITTEQKALNCPLGSKKWRRTTTHHSRTCGPARIPSWAGAVAWRAASPRVPLWPRRWPPRGPGKGCRRQRAPGGGPCSGSDQHRRISAAACLLATRPLEQDCGIIYTASFLR